MKLLVVLVGIASMVAGAAYVISEREEGVRAPSPHSFSANASDIAPGAESPMEQFERSIKMKAGTKKKLGEFELADGRRLGLYSADTTDSKSCLIDDDAKGGPSAGCLDDGLFHARKVAFSVNSQGGPQRFDELYVVGVVDPSVRGASLVKTNGSAVSLDLNAERAFLFESPDADLGAAIYPTELRLFGQSGKLVERVSFPPAG
jgi:hypothetical protein